MPGAMVAAHLAAWTLCFTVWLAILTHSASHASLETSRRTVGPRWATGKKNSCSSCQVDGALQAVDGSDFPATAVQTDHPGTTSEHNVEQRAVLGGTPAAFNDFSEQDSERGGVGVATRVPEKVS